MSLSDITYWSAYDIIEDVLRVCTAIAAVTAAIISFRAGRQIQEVRISINSRMDDLLKLTASSAHAEGVQQQRIEQEKKVDEQKVK